VRELHKGRRHTVLRALHELIRVQRMGLHARCPDRDPAAVFDKLLPRRLSASGALSTHGSKNPAVEVGVEGFVRVELFIDDDARVVQLVALICASIPSSRPPGAARHAPHHPSCRPTHAPACPERPPGHNSRSPRRSLRSSSGGARCRCGSARVW
jgi:hypothetical protein